MSQYYILSILSNFPIFYSDPKIWKLTYTQDKKQSTKTDSKSVVTDRKTTPVPRNAPEEGNRLPGAQDERETTFSLCLLSF